MCIFIQYSFTFRDQYISSFSEAVFFRNCKFAVAVCFQVFKTTGKLDSYYRLQSQTFSCCVSTFTLSHAVVNAHAYRSLFPSVTFCRILDYKLETLRHFICKHLRMHFLETRASSFIKYTIAHTLKKSILNIASIF